MSFCLFLSLTVSNRGEKKCKMPSVLNTTQKLDVPLMPLTPQRLERGRRLTVVVAAALCATCWHDCAVILQTIIVPETLLLKMRSNDHSNTFDLIVRSLKFIQ